MYNAKNHLCTFPNLELPITVDDIFTEEDYDLIYNREKFNEKVKQIDNNNTFGTGAKTNESLFGRSYAQTENLQWMYSPQEHKIPGSGKYTESGEDIILDKNQNKIIVGDRIHTDIELGKKIGAETVLVCTGEYQNVKKDNLKINNTLIYNTLTDYLLTI